MATDKLPNCERLSAVSDEKRAIEDFVDYLNECGCEIAEFDGNRLVPVPWTLESKLLEYFDINAVELDRERRALLESIRPSAGS